MRKYLLLCLLTLGCVATFVACGKDNEDGNKSNSEVIFNENGIVVTETEDQIVLIANLDNWDGEGVKATEKWVADFKDGKCVRALAYLTFNSADFAKDLYEEMIDDLDEDEDPNRYKLSGSTITSDMTGEMGGASKETIRGYFLRTAAEWSTGHYRY